jgi:hypothetical protein
MLLMSYNLIQFDIIPDWATIRINLAWHNTVKNLCQVLRHIDKRGNDVFLDFPSGRTKPPNKLIKLEYLAQIFHQFKNIKYFSISNVENKQDIGWLSHYVPPFINIVPKIESIRGIVNIKEIINSLEEPKIIMIDHDDLYKDLLMNKIDGTTMYACYINPLKRLCTKNNVEVLQTSGVVFSS